MIDRIEVIVEPEVNGFPELGLTYPQLRVHAQMNGQKYGSVEILPHQIDKFLFVHIMENITQAMAREMFP